jgi:hypothetical protein
MVKISKWGGSLAVRLPKELVEAGGFREGEDVDLNIRRRLKFQEEPEWSGWIAEARQLRKPVLDGDNFSRAELYEQKEFP